ncbi:MAG: ferredoxin--NADP reductase [Flavipsychrobacter sp.]|nr:ferredoxin--NADP reductase [Flavipsychrobacter sp.]
MLGVKTFTLTYDDGGVIPYIAGQFITFVFTHHGREERRSFSISSCAALSEPLSFTVKRIDNGAYSRLLTDKAAVGDTLFTTGAAGLFTLSGHTARYEQVFFFAAGIGITPVYSLVKTILHTEPNKQVVLIYSNRIKEEVVFYKELNELLTEFPDRFKIEFLYSTSFDLSRARLSKSLVAVLLQEYAAVPHDKMLFFICGPFAYMRMVIFALEEQGINSEQIRKENFNTNDRQVIQAEPPDKSTHLVTIQVNGAEHTFPVQYPETILQAAKKQGIQLPYSCEVGRCGSCAARCTKGKVWLSYNEVLMDMDLKHGSILTCTGHPVDGDVTIEV